MANSKRQCHPPWTPPSVSRSQNTYLACLAPNHQSVAVPLTVFALGTIKSSGRQLELRVEEIEKALDLALEPSDLVIILQRPANNHNYAVSFEQFVQDCLA
ncbi:uncharacterized protein EURHEDRAFT_55027 [Aspergillus ruber CBS 135680]|uniref:Uncharacterized protein n=1 Tax=Aspergillus ruber (strain CBS 135680) TaxID=1388766 RepID=A0A017SEV3_ASPRC|nr:uncharacterized protein EURHEDRAFT_55027 [Aspergillus ruber CBS 135680]EYE95311.1 hypothetical protein EURHEDRAFT_55027 [Aspergillus ruber CBS 135680]